MTGLLIVMQRHIIVQIIRKRVRNLANYISSGPGAGYHVHTRADLGISNDLKSVDQVTTNQTWLF